MEKEIFDDAASDLMSWLTECNFIKEEDADNVYDTILEVFQKYFGKYWVKNT